MSTSDRPARTALITGATSGIGYQLAILFARDGYDLWLVARSESDLRRVKEELARIGQGRMTILPKDLSLPHSPQEIFSAVKGAGVQVDVLVNNAGFGSHGLFAGLPLDTTLEELQVNVTALTHLTRLCLPDMVGRRHGKILNVASTAAFQPGPLMAVYYATKAYVLSFSEALANELGGTGVSVTTLCPGPTATNFQKRANMEHARLFRAKVMDAEFVARAGYRGMLRGKRIVIPGRVNRVLVVFVRLLPRAVVVAIARLLNDRA